MARVCSFILDKIQMKILISKRHLIDVDTQPTWSHILFVCLDYLHLLYLYFRQNNPST